MTTRLKTASAALLLALALSAPARAQAIHGLDGRWEGSLTSSSGEALTVILNVATASGKTTAGFDVPQQGGKNLDTKLSRDGNQVTFEVPDGGLKYVGTLSADGSKLTGDMTQGPTKTPVVFAHNVNTYVPPSTPAVAGLDGTWTGSISTPAGDLAVLFHVSTKDGRTTTLMDVPAQGVSEIPALAKRDGQSVSIDVPTVSGTFSGMASDASTVGGSWAQNGMEFPLQLKKQ